VWLDIAHCIEEWLIVTMHKQFPVSNSSSRVQTLDRPCKTGKSVFPFITFKGCIHSVLPGFSALGMLRWILSIFPLCGGAFKLWQTLEMIVQKWSNDVWPSQVDLHCYKIWMGELTRHWTVKRGPTFQWLTPYCDPWVL
jgi:hypothetical protein